MACSLTPSSIATELSAIPSGYSAATSSEHMCIIELKTDAVKHVPVHPVLAVMLAE